MMPYYSCDRACILIVNGGRDPEQGRWIELCLEKIIEHTKWENYHIYVWNNNVRDEIVVDFLEKLPSVTLVQADPGENLAHIHAVPLQRLYELARKLDNPKYIVTMDSDAHPLQKGWLKQLISSLNEEVVLSGVWRDELKKAIEPYIHASCLCTTVDFIEKNHIKLDFIAPKTETELHDTLSFLTETASAQGLGIFKLCRSNRNNFHRLMGGIYGDLIYHHGAGSRKSISFWDEERTEANSKQHQLIGETTANLLFEDYDRYIGWLLGKSQDREFVRQMEQIKNTGIPGGESKIPNGRLQFIRDRLKKLLSPCLNKSGSQPKPASDRSVAQVETEKKPQQNFSYMLRTFTESDLNPVPRGWRVGGPDFVGIGTPKAGTSWWYFLLQEHPQIVPHRLFSQDIPVSKELHYFLHFKERGIQESEIATYQQAFAAPEGSICGEWSTPYLCHPFCLEYLAQAAPKTKILVLLRNPIDRMASHINHVLSNRAKRFGLEAEKLYLFELYSTYPEAALHSLYGSGLRRLLKHFDRSQILVLQYEKCRANPQQELARTYRFLGVDERYLPQQFDREVNRQPYLIPPLKARERQQLAAYFADDVGGVVQMFPEVELSLWPDFLDGNPQY